MGIKDKLFDLSSDEILTTMNMKKYGFKNILKLFFATILLIVTFPLYAIATLIGLCCQVVYDNWDKLKKWVLTQYSEVMMYKALDKFLK